MDRPRYVQFIRCAVCGMALLVAEAHVCISGHERTAQETMIVQPAYLGATHEDTPDGRATDSTPRARKVDAGSAYKVGGVVGVPGTGTLTLSGSEPSVVRLNGGAV